jgi:primosomal protein N' (replication factor Y)
VRKGDVDILVGTQLLAKGLDLPKLTTLGVVIADTSLTFPDYSSEERTYQLLNQVIGRVGRGHSEHERIIVQSYDPERAVIRAALASDYDSFYKTEVEERRLFNFPPFVYVLKIACRRASSKAAEAAAEQFLYSTRQLGLPLLIEGPTPSFHTKIAGKYEWQLLVKSKDRSALLKVVDALPKSGWTYDIDPINLL